MPIVAGKEQVALPPGLAPARRPDEVGIPLLELETQAGAALVPQVEGCIATGAGQRPDWRDVPCA